VLHLHVPSVKIVSLVRIAWKTHPVKR